MQKWMPKSISGVNFSLDLCFQPFLRNSSKIHIFGLDKVSKDGGSETAKNRFSLVSPLNTFLGQFWLQKTILTAKNALNPV